MTYCARLQLTSSGKTRKKKLSAGLEVCACTHTAHTHAHTHDKHSTKPRQTSLLHHSSPGSPLAAESLVISVLKEELLDSFDEVFLDTQNPPGFLGA